MLHGKSGTGSAAAPPLAQVAAIDPETTEILARVEGGVTEAGSTLMDIPGAGRIVAAAPWRVPAWPPAPAGRRLCAGEHRFGLRAVDVHRARRIRAEAA